MAEQSQNVTILLDRLYNLTGEDNVIIKETEERITTAEERIEEIESSIAVTKSEQEEQENRLSLFLQHKNKFETVFAGLTDESFSALRDIDINLDMGALLSAVQTKSPEFIGGIMSEIDGCKNSIEDSEAEKSRILAELVVLKEELIVHSERRDQLASLLEQSLSPNEIERESLTASFVKRVLLPFGLFTPEEITRLTKLIMFPDEGLFEYDDSYAERVAKGLIGLVEEETPEETMEETIEEGTPEETMEDVSAESGLAPVEEEVVEETISTGTKIGEGEEDLEEGFEGPQVTLNFQQFQEDEFTKILEGATGDDDESASASEEDVEEEKKLSTEEEPVIPTFTEGVTPEETTEEEHEETVEDVLAALGVDLTSGEEEEVIIKPEEQTEEVDYTATIEFINRLGLDIEKFKEVNTKPIEDIYKSINQAGEEVVERNYEILRSINKGEEAYKMRFDHMYLTDLDLNKKITLLRAKNISEQKIQALIDQTNSGLRVSFEDLEKRIQSIENLHGNLEESNIYLISMDVAKYEENLDTLIKYGIDIDNKEARNYMTLLFQSLNIPQNAEILKNYIISILKNNGKYELSVFWKTPEELLFGIDDLVEAGLENIIATHPEILGKSTDQLLRRVQYCESEGKKVFSDDMNSEPCSYIINNDAFFKEFGTVDKPELVERKETNDRLVDVIGNSDYIEILLNTLDDYYAKAESFVTPEVDESIKDKYEDFCHYLEENAHAELAGKYTIKVDGVCICKTKMERNLAIILNTLASANQPTLGVEREIALVCALYNSRLTEEQLKKVAGSCLGFNSDAQEVITL